MLLSNINWITFLFVSKVSENSQEKLQQRWCDRSRTTRATRRWRLSTESDITPRAIHRAKVTPCPCQRHQRKTAQRILEIPLRQHAAGVERVLRLLLRANHEHSVFHRPGASQGVREVLVAGGWWNQEEQTHEHQYHELFRGLQLEDSPQMVTNTNEKCNKR